MTSDLEMEKSEKSSQSYLPHVPDVSYTLLWMGPSYLSPIPALTPHNKGVFPLWFFYFWCSYPSHAEWEIAEMMECDFRGSVIKGIVVSVLLVSLGSLQQSHGEVHMERKQGLLPTTSTNLPGTWRSCSGSRSFSPSQVLRRSHLCLTAWLEPHGRLWARVLLDSWPIETVR